MVCSIILLDTLKVTPVVSVSFPQITRIIVCRVIARDGSLYEPSRSNLRSRTNAALADERSSCTQEPIATSLPVHSDERPPTKNKVVQLSSRGALAPRGDLQLIQKEGDCFIRDRQNALSFAMTHHCVLSDFTAFPLSGTRDDNHMFDSLPCSFLKIANSDATSLILHLLACASGVYSPPRAMLPVFYKPICSIGPRARSVNRVVKFSLCENFETQSAGYRSSPFSRTIWLPPLSGG